jgi:ectoine hydroxylase-related dioxygenase (phytanoyl-CoA dioxygenase family)
MMTISNATNIGADAIRDEYWAKGYVALRGVFGEEDVAEWRREVERLWQLPGIGDDLNLRSEFRRTVEGTYTLDRLDPFLDLSEPLSRAMLDRRLLDPIASILGGAIQLLKCKLIRKAPDTSGYAPHQDHLYWRWLNMSPDALCSVAIPLYRSDALSGGIELFPGYHAGLLPSEDGDPDKDMSIANIDVSTGEIPALEPGDALVFHGLTPHRSGANRSEQPRMILLPSYAVSDDERLYPRYYDREIRRRCSEFVGFETIENATSDVLMPKT